MDLKDILKTLKLNESRISMIFGALVILVIGVLVVNYFRGLNQGQGEITQPGVTEERPIGQEIPTSLPQKHSVAKGENLWGISQKYFNSGYNWVDIASENKLKNPDRLLEGQELVIPKVARRQPLEELEALPKTGITDPDPVESQVPSTTQYTVVAGDNLWQIDVKNYNDGYKWVEIARANNLGNPNLIHAGNVLTLP